MPYFKVTFLALSILMGGSCKQIDRDNKLDFQVTNKTQDNISFLTISTTKGQGRTASYSILKGATANLDFGFDQVDKTDGSYQVIYKFSKSADTLTESFGYYTNGYPTEKALILKVYVDSVSVDRIPFGSY